MLSKGQLSHYGSVLLAATLIILQPSASWGQSISREQTMLAVRQLSAAFAMVASQVKPSVVNVSTTTIIPDNMITKVNPDTIVVCIIVAVLLQSY